MKRSMLRRWHSHHVPGEAIRIIDIVFHEIYEAKPRHCKEGVIFATGWSGLNQEMYR